MDNMWFRKGNKLDEFFGETCELTVSIEDLLDFIDGKKFETIEKCGCAFRDGEFVAYKWSRDADILKRLRNIGCSSVGVTELDEDGNKTDGSELVGLINNGDFYGAVTMKLLENEEEYIDYICERGY